MQIKVSRTQVLHGLVLSIVSNFSDLASRNEIIGIYEFSIKNSELLRYTKPECVRATGNSSSTYKMVDTTLDTEYKLTDEEVKTLFSTANEIITEMYPTLGALYLDWYDKTLVKFK